jgi:hypothetical protein
MHLGRIHGFDMRDFEEVDYVIACADDRIRARRRWRLLLSFVACARAIKRFLRILLRGTACSSSRFSRTARLPTVRRRATDLIRPRNSNLITTLLLPGAHKAQDHSTQQARAPVRDVARDGVRRVAGRGGGDGAAALGGHDEPGDQAGGETEPEGEEHCTRGHAGPEEDEADGDGGAADDYAEDSEETGYVYGDGVEDCAEAIFAVRHWSSIISRCRGWIGSHG